MVNKKILIAMSGGVDSAAAALILKNQGYQCQGVIMRLIDTPETEQSILDAHALADKLEIPLYVLDLRGEFKKNVIDNFVTTYEAGGTPNPCVECNKFLKFGALLDFCRRLGCDMLATGHYARIEYSEKFKRHLLYRASDPKKDQSYFLWHLTEEQLSHIIFPLGGYTKTEVRDIAEQAGLISARKKDSQDICFVPDGDYAKVISNLTGKVYPEGDFVDVSGKVLGRHRGMIHYTVGQRRGLNVSAAERLFVLRKNLAENTIVLCPKRDVMVDAFTVCRTNFIPLTTPTGVFRAQVKVRNTQPPVPADVVVMDGGCAQVILDDMMTATSSCQSVVFYDGDMVIGGGYLK